jgi:hypothetical protein
MVRGPWARLHMAATPRDVWIVAPHKKGGLVYRPPLHPCKSDAAQLTAEKKSFDFTGSGFMVLSPGCQLAGHTSSGWLCTYWKA